jgi:hypothetical protein
MPNIPRHMDARRTTPPIVENPRLPKMPVQPAAASPAPVGGKTLLMPAQPKQDTARTGRMTPFATVPAAKLLQPKVRPEMKGGEAMAEGSPKKEGYVRLRLRVSGDRVAVAGAAAVEGPLVSESKLDGDLAYEVLLGDKRVAVGSVPDAGVRRSFPAPRGQGEMQGHFVTEVPTFDVAVRIPASEVSLAALPKLDIALYRVKEELPTAPLEGRPLAEQFGRQLREVARLRGIRPDRLSEPIQVELRRALG